MRFMVLRRWVVVVVLSAITVASCGGSDADEPAKAPAPQNVADPARARKLQEVLDVQREGYGATGMAAAVIIRGRLVWAGGSGLANRETKTGVAADTPFPIFSITKMFMGALAVKLAEEGRLKLDDPLSGARADWPHADRITLRMLLNHTSGVGGELRPGNRLERAIDARPRAIWTPQRTLRYARRPHAAPGEKWEYNSANYLLAGLVIEKATGRTVAKLLDELILDPLKLRDTVLQPQERSRGEPARGYGGPPRIARALRIGGRYTPYPSEATAGWTAGGMVASARSVARFADALLRDHLLSPDSRRQLLRFVPATDGLEGYGLGVGKGETSTGTEAWGHFGTGPGFTTSVWYLPAKALTVAVLSSGEANLGSLTELLANTALDAG
jgi:D-alanyl-D-alanine carboxypeptidase